MKQEWRRKLQKALYVIFLGTVSGVTGGWLKDALSKDALKQEIRNDVKEIKEDVHEMKENLETGGSRLFESFRDFLQKNQSPTSPEKIEKENFQEKELLPVDQPGTLTPDSTEGGGSNVEEMEELLFPGGEFFDEEPAVEGEDSFGSYEEEP